jgi:hypothetical protein
MRNLVRLFAVSMVGIITFGSIVSAAKAPLPTPEPLSVALRASDRVPEPDIVFRHGDISWLPELAAEAGWPPETWKKLGQIILRESGGCPTRIGGSVVDKDCNLIRMATMSHPSDTGLLQVNGINWDLKRTKLAIVCVRMGVCTQEELMNPITNLRAGKLLFDVAGWSPWNPQK